MSDADEPGNVSTAFLAMITPTRRNPDRPVVEDEQYAEMLHRMIRGLEARAIRNPEMITQVILLAQRLAEVSNVAIAANAQRYKVDPRRGASIAECARLMGVSRQAAQQRAHLGDAVMERRVEASGAVRFSEAKRERESIQAAAKHAAEAFDEQRATVLREEREYRGRHLRVA